MAFALPVIRAEVVAVVNEAPATARVESSGAGSLEERIASLQQEAANGPDLLRRLRKFRERQQAVEKLWGRRASLRRRRAELPAAPTRVRPDGPSRLAVGESGDVCIKRWRTAPFGWLKVEAPIPRLVYEKVGTFTMRPAQA